MKKNVFLLAAVLAAFVSATAWSADTTFIYGKGGAEWEDGEWTTICPLWSDSICAIVITDDWGNTTTGIFGWPGGERVGRRFIYCPNAGTEICGLVLEGPNPGDPSTHAFFGKGGARQDRITGNWTYCPVPAQQICAIVQIGDGDGPTITTIYGAGGIYEHPDYVEYCPLDGDEVCATVVEIEEPDTIRVPGDTSHLPGDTVKGPGHGLGKSVIGHRRVVTPGGELADPKSGIRESADRVRKATQAAPAKTDLD